MAPALLLILSVAAAGSVRLQPIPGEPVAALFPPWWSAGHAFAAASASGGAIIRTGAWPTLLVAVSPSPLFAEKLRASGAWLILNPLALGACGAPAARRA